MGIGFTFNKIKNAITKLTTFLLVALITVAMPILVVTFREKIKESTYAKTKMEICDKMLKTGSQAMVFRHQTCR